MKFAFGRRSPRSRRQDDSRIHRVLLAVMGPPQLGRPDEPPAPPAPEDSALCRGCGFPWSQHEIVRDVFSPYSLCPSDEAATQSTGKTTVQIDPANVA
jgi:hypothetical protein